MRKMKVPYLPHSEVRVAFRQLPVTGAELSDVVMAENISKLSSMLALCILSTEQVFFLTRHLCPSHTPRFLLLCKEVKVHLVY